MEKYLLTLIFKVWIKENQWIMRVPKFLVLGLSLIIATILGLTSCKESYVTPPTNNKTYLKFLSPTGMNVLDSLKIIPDNNTVMEMDDADIMTVRGIRESDGKVLRMNNRFVRTSPRWGAGFPREESIAELGWGDFYNEDSDVYSILLQSAAVFNDNEIHTLKWYVRGHGNSYNAYKCEFDGVEVSLMDDPVYSKNSRGNYHALEALITVNTHK